MAAQFGLERGPTPVSLALRLSFVLVVALAGLVLALLAMASGHQSRLDEFYAGLLTANIVLAIAMAVLVVLVLHRAWSRYQQKAFGSRLMIRLALAFALMAIVPVALVSIVSSQFLAKTIDSWFSESVESGLESGASLGRATLDSIQLDAASQARRLAVSLESVADDNLAEAVETITEGREGLEVLVMNSKNKVLAIRSASLFRLVPDMPSAEALARARNSRQFVLIEPRPDAPEWALQVRAVVSSVPVFVGSDQIRFVQWVEPIPDALARNIDALNRGYSDYRQLALGKEGIRQIYEVTLTFTLLLAIFGALLAAVLLSAWLAGPLRSLDRATKAVAEGDYPRLRESGAGHELGDLIRSFNEMTRQLQEAKRIALDNQREREVTTRFLEQLLSHLSAGVMVFDERWRLIQFNPSASIILSQSLQPYVGRPLSELPALSSAADILEQRLQVEIEDQRQLDITRGDGQLVSLLVNASQMPAQSPLEHTQYVIVFDDISALLSAQRAKTWSDLARRLAHEIKNPLTPIQLSAERLLRKLTDRVNPDDREVLNKSCQTIVEQVAGLKAMVDEFRDYARLPEARPAPLNLRQLLQDVLPLYASDPRVKCADVAETPVVMADQAQMRQVIHNLIQNAQDALGDGVAGEILLSVGRHHANANAYLRVDDSGPGIAPEMQGKLFEPYSTNKPKGSGLGLAIVRKIAEENHATIALHNRVDAQGRVLGARAELQFAEVPNQAENSRHG